MRQVLVRREAIYSSPGYLRGQQTPVLKNHFNNAVQARVFIRRERESRTKQSGGGVVVVQGKWVEVQSGFRAASGRPLALAVPVIEPPQAQVPTAVSCNALKGSKWFVPGTAHQALSSGLHPAL